MPPNRLGKALRPLSHEQILLPKELAQIARNLTEYIDTIPVSERAQGQLNPIETISSSDAYRSLRQLIIDLGENIQRCDTRQAFLSVSLFLFWAVDELQRLQGKQCTDLNMIGEKLLQHYVATATLLEKQIRNELSAQRDDNAADRIESSQATNETESTQDRFAVSASVLANNHSSLCNNQPAGGNKKIKMQTTSNRLNRFCFQ